MAEKTTAVRKRQQIETAGRAMFAWVIAAAVVLGIAVTVSISLFEKLSYNQEVINKKNETVGALKHNNEIVDELKANARVLNTNKNLVDTPRPEGREPISVVLDALPSKANSAAFGASLQQRLLNENVSIESLVADPIVGAEDGESGSADASVQEITFKFTVTASAGEAGEKSLKNVLRNLERSIRTINVKSLKIEQQNSKVSLSVEGIGYFLPEQKIELKKEKV